MPYNITRIAKPFFIDLRDVGMNNTYHVSRNPFLRGLVKDALPSYMRTEKKNLRIKIFKNYVKQFLSVFSSFKQ